MAKAAGGFANVPGYCVCKVRCVAVLAFTDDSTCIDDSTFTDDRT